MGLYFSEFTVVCTLIALIGCQENPDTPDRSGEPTDQTLEVSDKESGKKRSGDQEGERDDDGEQSGSSDLMDQTADLLRRATDSAGGGADTTRQWLADRFGQATESGSVIVGDTTQWVNQMYQAAKKQGLTTADNARQWLSEDLANMNTLEYRIVSVDLTEPEAAEKLLNEMGRERWDCFHAIQRSDETVLMLKRPRRSVLRDIPTRDLIRLIPLMGTGDGAE